MGSVPVHELKTWPGPFEAVRRGAKTYEIRKDDRGFAVNDALLLREWDPETRAYSGRRMWRRVSYLTRGPEWGVPDGMVVLALDPVAKGADLAEVFGKWPGDETDEEIFAALKREG